MPEQLKTVNEKSKAWLNVEFFDKDGQPAAPVTLNIRVDDDKGNAIANVVVSPAQTIEIPLSAGINTFLDRNSRVEYRIVTVNAGFGIDPDDDQFNADYHYRVQGLKYVDQPTTTTTT